MGLGKTVQSIALLAHLAEVRGHGAQGFLCAHVKKAFQEIRWIFLLLLTNENIQYPAPASFFVPNFCLWVPSDAS